MSGDDNKARILVVTDGKSWYVRQVRLSVHEWERDEMVYHCDKHLGGPYESLDIAAEAAKRWL